MSAEQAPLRALAAVVAAEGGLLAGAVEGGEGVVDRAGLGALAASGPRARENPAEYALLVEAIREGFLLHRGEGRVLRPDDPDLALLGGDRLYALGLARLAELGDLEAVTELADVIALAARAQAAGDDRLAESVWRAGAVAVGWGSDPAHAAAKGQALVGAPGAAEALDAAADGRRGAAGR